MPHVLIVEDHEENRNLLKMLLEANGYRVTVAGDGLEALAAARRDQPDVIVSDVLMPNMDGFALCREWMQDDTLKAIPFIFYSATYVRIEDKEFGLAVGAVRYLIKPMEAQAFLGELRETLQQWAGKTAPARAQPLDDLAVNALHKLALARKVEDKIAQLEATNRRLLESEARFRGLAEMSSDFYWESDAGRRLTLRTSPGRKASAVRIPERDAQSRERRREIPPYLSPEGPGWRCTAQCSTRTSRSANSSSYGWTATAACAFSRSAAIRCSMPPARSPAIAASARTSLTRSGQKSRSSVTWRKSKSRS